VFGQFGFVLGGEQGEVVDAGAGWRRHRFGSGHGVGVAADHSGDAGAHCSALVADLDRGEVEGVIDALDAAADEGGVDFEGVGVQADGGRFGDGALVGPQERLVQLGWCGDGEGPAGDEPLERCRVGLGVDPAVVGGFDPGGEQPVHLDEVVDAAGFDLDEELVAHGAEETFDLAPALGPSRS